MIISVASAGIIRGPWSICGGVQHHLSLKIVGDGGFFSDIVRPKSVTVVGVCPEQDSTWVQSHVQCFRFQKREISLDQFHVSVMHSVAPCHHLCADLVKAEIEIEIGLIKIDLLIKPALVKSIRSWSNRHRIDLMAKSWRGN